MKIATFLIIALVNIGISFVSFFMLLLAMNGFHEDEATPGLLLFIVWGLLSAIIMGVLGILLVNYLAVKKSMNKIASAVLSMTIFIGVGGVSIVAGFFAAVFLASAMR
jgi:hypothetical protein